MGHLPSIPYYSVTRLIQRGGTSVVYEGKDLRNGSTVAIKALYPDNIRDEFMLKRFKEEANHYLLLSHPYLPNLVDFVEHGGRMYLVMEYVKGMDMSCFLKQYGPLNEDTTANFFSMLADTIGYLHEQDILHLDIKPSNIMITEGWNIKVLDLGISAMVSESETLKKKCGSPSFMAPEQIKGEKLGFYTDIYQIGATLFNMITGHVPYDGSSRKEIYKRICNEPSPRLSGLSAQLMNLQSVIDKSMHKDVKQRYASCEQLKQDLLECLSADIKDIESSTNQEIINKSSNMRIIKIGRELDNDFVIQDPYVGRHHLELIQDDGGNFFARDLNSTNGTFVNGHRITGEVSLSSQDIIRIGTTTLPWINYFANSNDTVVEPVAKPSKFSRKSKDPEKSQKWKARYKKMFSGIWKWVGRLLLTVISCLTIWLIHKYLLSRF